MSVTPKPSQSALALVQGAYDLHVHTGPDVLPRKANDVEVAQAFRKVGLKGFVIKSHYFPTGARARLVSALVPGVRAVGAICLNRSVGGLNPLAVELAAREGARVVWLPTVDAHNERSVLERESGKKPFWALIVEELEKEGFKAAPVPRLAPDDELLQEVLKIVARRNLILATGHVGKDEIGLVVEMAKKAGVRCILITHPDFPSQNLSAEEQKALTKYEGVFLERCFTTAFSGKISWEDMVERIALVGPQYSFISSDLGQPNNPPPEWGLPLMVDFLMQHGLKEKDVVPMIENTKRVMAFITEPRPEP